MRDDGTEDHGGAENDQDGAVASGRLFAGRRGAGFVVGGEDLDEDGAELAGGGADAVAEGAVAGWEDFGGDDVRGCVWACDHCLCVVSYVADGEEGGRKRPVICGLG